MNPEWMSNTREQCQIALQLESNSAVLIEKFEEISEKGNFSRL